MVVFCQSRPILFYPLKPATLITDKEIKNWIKEMESFVKSHGKEIKKLYFWYTTCPSCAKQYGKNYTVLVAKV